MNKLTPEQKRERVRAARRTRHAAMSPEERQRFCDDLRAQRARRVARETPEQAELRQVKLQAARKKLWQATNADPERKAAQLEQRRAAKKRKRKELAEIGITFYSLKSEKEHARDKERQREWNRRARQARVSSYVESVDRQREKRRATAANKRASVAILSSDQVMRLIGAAVPRASRWFPEATRWDVISDLCLAMLEGKCSPDDLPRQVKEAMKPYSNHANKELSLAAPVPGTEGKQTYLDRLEGGL